MEQRGTKNILVTGGCGFIGWNFLKRLFLRNELHFENIINVDDKCECAINPEYDEWYDSRYFFIKGDIGDKNLIENVLQKYEIDTVVNFAAKTHVDNSIKDFGKSFVETNVNGFYNLMVCCQTFWGKNSINGLFIDINTDEVFGSVEHNNGESFNEMTPMKPNNPYSATKAAATMLAHSFHNTYNFPVISTYCSNNYGPGQYFEKLIPKIIYNSINNKVVPVYGDGLQARDWLYVDDHCRGLIQAIKYGKPGQKYLFGTNKNIYNIDIVLTVLEKVKKRIPTQTRIKHVSDRPGHDRTYRIDYTKARCALDWTPSVSIEEGLENTVEWYINKFHAK